MVCDVGVIIKAVVVFDNGCVGGSSAEVVIMERAMLEQHILLASSSGMAPTRPEASGSPPTCSDREQEHKN